MPKSSSRSSGCGLKNVHWSPSKSSRTACPSPASGSSPRACSELDQDVGVAVRLRVGALAAVQGVRAVRRRVEAEEADHAGRARRSRAPELRADLVRPRVDVEAVGAEERERDALEAEAEARGVGDRRRRRSRARRSSVKWSWW